MRAKCNGLFVGRCDRHNPPVTLALPCRRPLQGVNAYAGLRVDTKACRASKGRDRRGTEETAALFGFNPGSGNELQVRTKACHQVKASLQDSMEIVFRQTATI